MYKITGNYKVHTDKAYKVQNAPIYKKFSLIPSNLASWPITCILFHKYAPNLADQPTIIPPKTTFGNNNVFALLAMAIKPTVDKPKLKLYDKSVNTSLYFT